MRLLSRRDDRIQPGVLTPGYQNKKAPPQRGGRGFWTNDRSINETTNRHLPPLQGGWSSDQYPGLKPRAESCSPFGTEIRSRQIGNPISPTLHYSARQKSRTAARLSSPKSCPTKPKLYSADCSSRPRKRGTLHSQDAREVERTRTKCSYTP